MPLHRRDQQCHGSDPLQGTAALPPAFLQVRVWVYPWPRRKFEKKVGGAEGEKRVQVNFETS